MSMIKTVRLNKGVALIVKLVKLTKVIQTKKKIRSSTNIWKRKNNNKRLDQPKTSKKNSRHLLTLRLTLKIKRNQTKDYWKKIINIQKLLKK